MTDDNRFPPTPGVQDVVRRVSEADAAAQRRTAPHATPARADAAALMALIRDALPHISDEVEQRKTSGNDEYFADLEAIERRMVDALRAPLPVYLVAYDMDEEDSPAYACAFSTKARAEEFAASIDGGHVIETGVDTHAPCEEAAAMAEEIDDKASRRGVWSR